MRSNLGCGVPSYTSSSPTSFDPSSEIMRTMMVISGSLNLRCDIAYENIFSFTKNIERFVRILIVVNQRVEVYLLQTLGI